nr:TetR-like C-terminal domain-containing protein [uncultured Oscillibacter sp.]
MKAWPAGALFGWTGEWIRRGMQETPEQMQALRNTQTGQAESSRP